MSIYEFFARLIFSFIVIFLCFFGAGMFGIALFGPNGIIIYGITGMTIGIVAGIKAGFGEIKFR